MESNALIEIVPPLSLQSVACSPTAARTPGMPRSSDTKTSSTGASMYPAPMFDELTARSPRNTPGMTSITDCSKLRANVHSQRTVPSPTPIVDITSAVRRGLRISVPNAMRMVGPPDATAEPIGPLRATSIGRATSAATTRSRALAVNPRTAEPVEICATSAIDAVVATSPRTVQGKTPIPLSCSPPRRRSVSATDTCAARHAGRNAADRTARNPRQAARTMEVGRTLNSTSANGSFDVSAVAIAPIGSNTRAMAIPSGRPSAMPTAATMRLSFASSHQTRLARTPTARSTASPEVRASKTLLRRLKAIRKAATSPSSPTAFASICPD